MKKYKVGIIGATGMVGQRFLSILENHPWFEVSLLAASKKNEGKTFLEAVGNRWLLEKKIPTKYENMIVSSADSVKKNVSCVDFIFCAVNMKKNEIKQLEVEYAKNECPVISNNSAHRDIQDVPMVIPEINPEHLSVIKLQLKRYGTKRGFIAVKSNCSLQSYVPPLHPLRKFGLKEVKVCTYQAISGSGKTFKTWPDMIDNIIPYIEGEEQKSEKEPLKIWGKVTREGIVNSSLPKISAQCIRVPISDGHMAAVFAKFEKPITIEKIKDAWEEFSSSVKKDLLPSSPKNFLNFFEENDRPQNRLDANADNGMAISVGRLRLDGVKSCKFVCLSHNTLRGAAGGAVLMAELLAKKRLFKLI